MADILTPDLCVIGAGSGGLAVAERARAYGASVVLVEKARLGGSALNTGAIPAKALLAAAAHAQSVRDGAPLGIAADEPKVNFRRVHDHIEQVIVSLAPASAIQKLKVLGIDVLMGAAHFVSRKAVVVGETEIRARHFVVATGAKPRVPPIPGLDGVPFFTADTILDNARKLTHLVVIGGGAIGIELAQAYKRLGTQVTVVDEGQLLAAFDPELAAVALRRVGEEGVRLLPNTTVTAIQARSMGIGVAIRDGDTDQVLDASHILVAGARQPGFDGLDLDKAGVKRSKTDPALLQLSGALRTSNPRIFAVGDAAGGHSVPAALHQAEKVVRAALLGSLARTSDQPLPVLLSTDPGIAEIGLNERTARTRHGTAFRVTRAAFADNDAARASRQTLGLAKLLTDRAGKIIGAGVVGPGASELVSLFSLAMSAGLPASKLAEFAVPYPSIAEIAVRLGMDFQRGAAQGPLVKQWIALNRLLG